MAVRLTKKQRIAAVKIYYECSGNGAEGSRRLSKQFDIPAPQGRNITNLVKKFEESGSIADAPRSGRPSTATTEEKDDGMIKALTRSPQKSSRRFVSELHISQRSVLRLLQSR